MKRTIPTAIPKPNDSRIIDLGDYVSPKTKMLVGNGIGLQLRDKLNLNRVDTERIPTLIVFPHYVHAVSDSFLDGFLCQSIRYLGNEFNKVYSFDGEEPMLKSLEQDVQRLVERTTANRIEQKNRTLDFG